MSQLRIIAPASIAAGYALAGADVYVTEDAATTAQLLRRWLQERAEGLVAIEERLLSSVDAALLQSLADYSLLPILPLPSGEPVPPEVGSRARIAELIREAVGHHITFAGDRS